MRKRCARHDTRRKRDASWDEFAKRQVIWSKNGVVEVAEEVEVAGGARS